MEQNPLFDLPAVTRQNPQSIVDQSILAHRYAHLAAQETLRVVEETYPGLAVDEETGGEWDPHDLDKLAEAANQLRSARAMLSNTIDLLDKMRAEKLPNNRLFLIRQAEQAIPF